jgi:hypothetical protein
MHQHHLKCLLAVHQRHIRGKPDKTNATPARGMVIPGIGYDTANMHQQQIGLLLYGEGGFVCESTQNAQVMRVQADGTASAAPLPSAIEPPSLMVRLPRTGSDP